MLLVRMKIFNLNKIRCLPGTVNGYEASVGALDEDLGGRDASTLIFFLAGVPFTIQPGIITSINFIYIDHRKHWFAVGVVQRGNRSTLTT